MQYIPLDIETIGLRLWRGVIWIVSFGTQLYHDCKGLKRLPINVIKQLEDENICKIVHSSEFDAPYMQMNLEHKPKIHNLWDTRLCEIVLIGRQLPKNATEQDRLKWGTRLTDLLHRYKMPVHDKKIRANYVNRPVGIKFTKEELDYPIADIKFLPALQQAQEFLLRRDGQMEVALLENKVAEVVTQMRVNGLGIDKVLWLEIADRNLQHYQRLCHALPREVDNWNSPLQVKKFFHNRGTHIESFKELDKVYSVTKDRVLGKFIEARNLYSDATSYGAAWLKRNDGTSTIDPDGRIRCNFEQILNTGRFATNNPNILALPKDGLQRNAIVPRKGYCFVIGDYTGQEIGIMAAAAQEDTWIEALMRGDSIHALVASVVFKAEWEAVYQKGCTFPKKCKCAGHQDATGLPYWKAKKIVFMQAYGGGAGKFHEITGIEMLKSRVIMNKFERSVPNLTRYLNNNAREALRTGVSYSADPYKRRRVLNGEADWRIENQGKNNPIQGAGANMLKLAMISIYEKYEIALPFHDELVLEVPIKASKKASNILKEIMEQSAAYITGIKGLIKIEPRIAMNFAKVKK